MKKVKNIIMVTLLTITFLLPIPVTKAAGATINVSNSKKNVVVGNTFTTTVTISSSSTLGAWNFDVKYDTAKLQLVSSSFGGTYIVDYGNGTKKSATYTFTFKAKASGTANIYIANSKVLAYDETDLSVNNGSSSVKVMTQSELEDTYSKNNYLSSLSIEGATMTPSFNKDTLEYKVELENDVTSIKINAKAEDYRSRITGTGEVKVSEGENKIQIKVTAENGNVRTYTINATVKELSPITVNINGENYNIVRKKENLTPPTNFTETTITIQGEEIPAFYNEVTKYTLVGLKNKEGEIHLYIYNPNDESYTIYHEMVFNRVIFQLLDAPKNEIPKGYKEVKLTLFDQEITGYRTKDTSRFTLLYGLNMENGNKGFYIYDNYEETLQRYDSEAQDIFKKQNDQYFLGIIILGSISIVLSITIIAILIHSTKKNKPKKEIHGKHQEKKEIV